MIAEGEDRAGYSRSFFADAHTPFVRAIPDEVKVMCESSITALPRSEHLSKDQFRGPTAKTGSPKLLSLDG